MRGLVEFFVRRVVVDGPSMAPTLRQGERATALRRWRRVRVGDVVVVVDPRDPERWLIKRCVARTRGLLDLRGDNPDQSTDSRHFGMVPASSVAYLVLQSPRRQPSGSTES